MNQYDKDKYTYTVIHLNVLVRHRYVYNSLKYICMAWIHM